MRKVLTALSAALLLSSGVALADEQAAAALEGQGVTMDSATRANVASATGADLASVMAALVTNGASEGAVVAAMSATHPALLKFLAAELFQGSTKEEAEAYATKVTVDATNHYRDVLVHLLLSSGLEEDVNGLGVGLRGKTGMGQPGGHSGEGSPYSNQ